MSSTAVCELCAGPPVAGHNFCEGCGRDLRGDADRWWRSSTAGPDPCPGCGGTEYSPDGYCEACGRRRNAGQDHVELAIGGIAAVTDKGRHKQRNEDAVAIGRVGDATIAVVCDGVSTSIRADEASHAGVDAAIAALGTALSGGEPPAQAIVAGTRAAAEAVARLATPETVASPPSCTFVAAVVTDSEVVVGWVGDSRAYWLADQPAESRRLTIDDSLAGQLAAAGVATEAGEGRDPRLTALARWLGADAEDTEPRIASFQPTGPGRVLVCSDGLHRYLSDPAKLAVTAPGAPADTARALNQLSLDAGGADNIAIAILPFPPVSPADPPVTAEEPTE
ncbi:MAG TPA: protein phosphatase 2C domain-containing protein [Natronosporangium sp.]